MTINEEINRQIKHIEAKITAMEAYSPYKTEKTIEASYWCGRQTATTTIDFIDTLCSLGLITPKEHAEYCNRIGNLHNMLVKTHNALSNN